MSSKIKEFWNQFCDNKNIPKNTEYYAWSFGNNKKMADELAELVNQNIKKATTSAYELYESGEHIPKEGEYNIILDGSENPVCITQTKAVSIIPYNLITAEHAWLEGEGDRSYTYWRNAHDKFFHEEYTMLGKTFHEQDLMVCEVFEKVY